MAENGAALPPYPLDEPPELFYKIRHPGKRAFLIGYSLSGKLGDAQAAAACSRDIHYKWLRSDPDYADAFAEAQQMALDVLEEEATRRALGWDETRYTNDGTPYTVRKYSDVMLIVRLKALAPDKYRDNARKEERQDISDLLKAVLLELADRHTLPAPAQEAEWAPLPPSERTNGQDRRALPEPPGIDEEG